MWTSVEPWQITQLQRLAALDPERVEALMNHLYDVQPTLLLELAISAVDQEQMSVSQCADLTGLQEDQVEHQLVAYRNRAVRSEAVVEMDTERNLAKLTSSGIPVWEVVRAFRIRGSVVGLSDAFPSLPISELHAALSYSERHPEEIEGQIARYEETRVKKMAEYPSLR